MRGKKTILVRVAYLVELPEKAIGPDNGMLEKVTSHLSENRNLVIDDKHIT